LARRSSYHGIALSIIIAGTIGLLPRMASATELAPLNVPASDEHHAGKRIFAELVTPDLAAAKQFYGMLFGWTFQDYAPGDIMFTQASLDGEVVGGIYQRPLPQGRQPGWMSFIATSDLAKTTSLATHDGARLLLSPRPFANLGQEAVLADPQGAVFGVLQSSSGDPPDFLAAPGDWIWSSLITTDPGTSAAFYQTVFAYAVFELPDAQDAQHLILTSDDYARASINPIPSAWKGATPSWLNYIRVDDATAMCVRVTALGGRVVQPPRIDRHGGGIAVVADPAGALFGLMEWPEDEPAGDAK
jgi:predicted enzyme related to lactoylglutathione lyase